MLCRDLIESLVDGQGPYIVDMSPLVGKLGDIDPMVIQDAMSSMLLEL